MMNAEVRHHHNEVLPNGLANKYKRVLSENIKMLFTVPPDKPTDCMSTSKTMQYTEITYSTISIYFADATEPDSYDIQNCTQFGYGKNIVHIRHL